MHSSLMPSFLESILPHVNLSRKSAWQRACALGLPFESFQYVPMPHIFNKKLERRQKEVNLTDLEKAIFPECKDSLLVFVDGVFSDSLSCKSALPPSFFSMPLSDAEIQFEAFLSGRNEMLLREEKDPFALLNYACFEEGMFLYLPPKLKLNVPLQILNVYTGSSSHSCPRTMFFMGKESQCDVYINEFFLEEQKSGWINSFLDVVLEERASVNIYTLFGEASEMVHTDSVRVQLKKESSLKMLSFGTGKQVQRLDFSVNLYKDARAILLGAFLLNNKLETHIHTAVEHKEENAYSLQKFKAALNDQSRTSFTGKIHVRKEAQRTQAYQLNNNMILSDFARVYSKPNLEIFADDVKASHGATIGKLNDEDLFYFKTRGLPDKIARKLLIEGFYQEILQQIPLHSAKEYIKHGN